MASPFDSSKFLTQGKPLTNPILVGGTMQTGWVVGPLVVAAILLGIGIVVTIKGAFIEALYFFVPVSIAIAIPGAVAAGIQLARRRWLEVTMNGFVITRRTGERQSFDDTQIVAVSQNTWPRADGSYLRRVVVEVQANEYIDSIECFYYVAVGTADPLWSFVDRNVRALARRVEASLSTGGSLSGQGWHYDAAGLHIHHGAESGTYSLNELTFLCFYSNQMFVWRGIEELPLFRIAESSQNAHALGQVLWAPMEKRPGLYDPLPGRPLGRRLFTKTGRDGPLGISLMVLFGMVGSLLFFASLFQTNSFDQFGLLIGASVISSFALLGAWLVYRAYYMQLAYHQFGVAQPRRGRELLFTEIGTMTWTANSIFLDPLPHLAKQSIRFQAVSMHFDNDLVQMRDHVAGAIARRWWEELAAGPVKWTTIMRFLPGGLEYRPAGVFGSGEPITAPYHLTSYYLLQGWLELFVSGQTRAVLKQMYVTPNFYPGLTLLNWIYESMKQQQTQQGQQAAQTTEAKPDFSMPFHKDDRVTNADRPTFSPSE